MPTKINHRLVSWGSEIDELTIRQAEKAARLPIVEGDVALMPDGHVGIGATVGSVIPTRNAVIPSALGVDIGCGMMAAELDVTADQLPDTLEPLLEHISRLHRRRVLSHHGEERLQVERQRPQRVGSDPASHELEIAIKQRMTERIAGLTPTTRRPEPGMGRNSSEQTPNIQRDTRGCNVDHPCIERSAWRGGSRLTRAMAGGRSAHAVRRRAGGAAQGGGGRVTSAAWWSTKGSLQPPEVPSVLGMPSLLC